MDLKGLTSIVAYSELPFCLSKDAFALYLVNLLLSYKTSDMLYYKFSEILMLKRTNYARNYICRNFLEKRTSWQTSSIELSLLPSIQIIILEVLTKNQDCYLNVLIIYFKHLFLNYFRLSILKTFTILSTKTWPCPPYLCKFLYNFIPQKVQVYFLNITTFSLHFHAYANKPGHILQNEKKFPFINNENNEK